MPDPIDYSALANQARSIDYSALANQARQGKTFGDQLFDIPKAFWDNMVSAGQGMIETAKAVMDTATNPTPGGIATDTAKGRGVFAFGQGMGQAQAVPLQKAVDAFKRGNTVEAVRHFAHYMVPMVGPQLDQAGDQYQQGEWGKGTGNTLGVAAQTVGPAALNRLVAPVYPGAATPPAAIEGSPVVSPLLNNVPMPSGPLVPRTLNPVAAAGVDYLRENEVPLNVGTITGNKFARAAQAIAQNQPLGATIAAKATRATEEGLIRVSGELADSTYPKPVTPESAGQAVSNALNENIAGFTAAEDKAYGKAWEHANDPAFVEQVPIRYMRRPILDDQGQLTGKTQRVPIVKGVSMPVDVRNLKADLKPVWQDLQWMPASDRAASAGYQAVKNILDGDDFISAAQAERGLGGLKSMSRVDNQNLRNTSQGIGAQIIPQLQDAIDTAVAKTGPDALRGLQQGRALHASKMDVSELADKLREEPVQIFNQLTWRQDTGIDFLRKLNQQAPEVMAQVGRGFIQQLFDQATREGGFGRTRGLLNAWQNLGPETKALLFKNPQLRQGLDRFFIGANEVAQNPNPSGSAVVGSLIPGGLLVIHSPLSGAAWLIGGYAASKLLFSPRGVALLTENLKPAANPGAAAMAASQILRIAGEEGVTPIKPGSTIANPPANDIVSIGAKDAGRVSEPPNGEEPPGTGGVGPAVSGPNQPGGGASPGAAAGGKPPNGEEPPGTAGLGPAVSEPARSGDGTSPGAAATTTRVPVPGVPGRFYKAEYKLRELDDVQPSHNGLNFQPNSKYTLRNDRNYSAPENQAKVVNWSTSAEFDPHYHITDNPDASNGPVLVDSRGNALGGNGRAMILQRVYANNPAAAQAYRDLLTRKAAQFGIDPEQVKGMKQPVLVREVPDSELAGSQQRSITDFNKIGTAALKPSEQAVADSRGVSAGTLDHLASELDAKGPDATLAEVLEGRKGIDILNRLIDDGVIASQERAAYATENGLTAAGKTRVQKLMLGRFFLDPVQMDTLPPSVVGKIERLAAPLSKLEADPAWSLSPDIQQAMQLLEDARAHSMKDLDFFLKNKGLFGDQEYSPQAIALAKHLQNAKPTELTQAVQAYAEHAKYAREYQGPGMFNEFPDPKTPAQAFAELLGAKLKPVAKKNPPPEPNALKF